MSKVSQAVVMVGGKGTRLRPLTDTMPKPILPVLDRPCLSYLIESLANGGVEHVILACGYRSEQLVEAIGNGSEYGIEIDYSYEDVPMGTAGAIKLLENDLDDVFIATNGDVFTTLDLNGELEAHFSTNAEVTLSLTRVENPCEFGIARVDDENRILEFKEKPKPEEVFSDLINAGVYVVNKDALQYVPEGQQYDFSKELVPLLMDRGYRIQAHILDGLWIDVGRPSDLILANKVMAERKFGAFDWKQNFKDSSISGTFYAGKNTTMKETSSTDSVVSENTSIKGSELSGSLIFKNCSIENSKIINSIIGRGCTVRSSTIENRVIGDNVNIENNEEI